MKEKDAKPLGMSAIVLEDALSLQRSGLRERLVSRNNIIDDSTLNE